MKLNELKEYVNEVQHSNYVELTPKTGYTLYHGEELNKITLIDSVVQLHFADSFVRGYAESELGSFVVSAV